MLRSLVGSEMCIRDRYRILAPVEGYCIAYLPTLSTSSATPTPTNNSRRPSNAVAPLRPLFERTDAGSSSPTTAQSKQSSRAHAAPVLPSSSSSSESNDDEDENDGNRGVGGRVRRCELPQMLLENPDDFLSRISVLIPHSSDGEEGGEDDNNMYSQVEGVFGRGHIGGSGSSNDDDDDETSSDDELVIVDGATGERIHHPDSKISNNRTNSHAAAPFGGAPPPPLPQEDHYHFIGGGVGRVVRAPSSGAAPEVGYGIVSKPPSPVISRRQSPLSKPRSPQSRKVKIVESVAVTSPSSDHRKHHTTSPPLTPPSTRQAKKG
eukprot:TRINITY_DN7194_c0_g1_i5.p1 TRINITY_DN7194_c0_g1~~TRINITY_DN7194_c0_g1_i5.p1  ORF type:complete len:355 (+),score=128.36 TRINITY_DN7194_c0_g1_i5:105-1067(+)